MTISSSYNASVAALSANASRLSAISDNIANASTYGYKRVSTDFESMVIDSGSGSFSAGGVRITTTRLIDEGGSLVSTANATDIAVQGRGMLPVTPANAVLAGGATPMLLTTTGSFRPDADGYLRSDSGLILMGWPATADGTVPNFPRDTQSGLEPIRVNTTQFGGEATTNIRFAVNLPATSTEAGAAGTAEDLSLQYFDNLGTSKTLSVTFAPTVPATGSSNEWTMTVRDSASGDAVVGEYTLTFDDARGTGGTLLSVNTVSGGAFDPATGKLTVNVAGGPIEIDIGEPGSPMGLTQLSDRFAPVAISKNGAPVGNMTKVEIDQNGFVRAFFDIGSSKVIYQVPLVDMPNPNGLKSLDRQTYAPTPASGPYFLWNAGDGPTGSVIAYAREESATDIAGELTRLIQTQRAYSSNAKVIQTVDEMMQETSNIKR